MSDKIQKNKEVYLIVNDVTDELMFVHKSEKEFCKAYLTIANDEWIGNCKFYRAVELSVEIENKVIIKDK